MAVPYRRVRKNPITPYNGAADGETHSDGVRRTSSVRCWF